MKCIYNKIFRNKFVQCFLIIGYGIVGLSTALLLGQGAHPTIWSSHVLAGKILPHTDEFPQGLNGWTRSLQVEYIKIRSGNKQWHQDWRYPEVGGRLDFSDFGEGQFLGRSIGLVPFIRWSNRSTKSFLWYADIGGGIAYLSHPYHILTNPDNTVIGTHWNNLTQLRSGIHWVLGTHHELSTSIVLSHFSNGKIKSPNLGINTASISLGYRYFLNRLEAPPYSPNNNKESSWGLAYQIGLGIHDGGLGTPVHPVWIHSISLTRQTSRIHRIWSGITYAWDRYKYQILSLQLPYDMQRISNQSSDISVWLGTEWIAGNVSIWLQSGYYLYHPFQKPSPIYFKFGTHYYPFQNEHLKGLFCGVNIKSHFGIADYFEFRLGYLYSLSTSQ